MNTRNFISRAQVAEILNKKERANRSLELANFEANLNKLCPKKIKRTMLNHNSPNVRERLGYCKQIN